MTIKINSPITSFEVVKDQVSDLNMNQNKQTANKVDEFSLKPDIHYLDIELPKRKNGPLYGLSMKVKNTTTEEASMYVTCNFTKMVSGAYRLSEVFLNCKESNNLQWATLATRQLSALARKTGRIGFMIEEMKQVSDASGGYRVYIDEDDLKPTYVKSCVAHIGHCIERACLHFDVIDSQGSIKEHANGYNLSAGLSLTASDENTLPEEEFNHAVHGVEGMGIADCKKCGGLKTVVNMDNCMTCLSCSDSKCG